MSTIVSSFFIATVSVSIDMTVYIYSGPTATLRKKKSHIAWTKEEKDAVFKYLGEFVKRKIVPGKRECENCIKQSGGLLANRDWKVVKDCVRNVLSRAKTLQEKNT